MTDIQNKSQEELLALIAEAQTQLEILRRSERKEVIAQIKELAVSIGVTVDIHETSKATSAKIPAKFSNPDNPSQTWTGRGMAPKWLKDLVEKGHNKDEFLIDNNTQ
jgi:DNA-binding protein H-NS